jgi:hypothetical protein
VISGAYGLSHGGRITGVVHLPAPVDERIEVSFLVDTGATHTCISLIDLLRLSSQVPETIAISHRDPLWGLGGAVPGLATPASVAFLHEDSTTSRFVLDVGLLLSPDTAGIPSVLGRDILFRGDLHFDPAAGAVYFDAPRGSFVI